jgi:type I restriction enzyme S subunit
MRKGWELKKIGEICENLDSKRKPITKKNRTDGDIPYYGATGIVDYVNDYMFNEKLVLLGEDGAKWNSGDECAFIVKGKTWVNNHAHVLRPNRNIILDEWMVYNLNFQDLSPYVSGMTVPKLNQAKMNEIPIPVPPLPEQKRIVAILDETFAAIDKAKANVEKNLQNAKKLFDSVLDGIFYDKKWNVKQLGDVCTRVEYGSSTKSTVKGKLPVLRMGNIQNGRFVWDSLVYSDKEEDNKQYLLKYNDVLFNRTNSPELVGKTAIYKGEMPAIFAGYLIRIHRKEDLLDADYLNYFLNSKIAKEYGKTVVISSVNQANINGTKLKTYPVPLPTLKEQETIVQQLDALRSQTQMMEILYLNKLVKLEELEKSILKRAFAGEEFTNLNPTSI